MKNEKTQSPKLFSANFEGNIQDLIAKHKNDNCQTSGNCTHTGWGD